MAAPNSTVETMRRSTRLRLELPVRVRSLDQKTPFDILTRTLIVNAQGCGLQSTVEIPAETRVELAIEDRVTCGRVLNSTLADSERNIWVVGVELDESGNFWGVVPPPADWVSTETTASTAGLSGAEPSASRPHPFAKRKAPKTAIADTPLPQITPEAAPVPSPLPSRNAEELRNRFDSMLEEFGARLRTQVSADWDRWRTDAAATLGEIQKELGRKIAADADRWRQETQKASDSLSALLKSSDDRARIAEEQGKQISAVVTSAQAEISAALERLQLASTGAQTTGEQASADAQAARDEIARLKSELRDLAAKAPAMVEGIIHERAAKTMDSLGGEIDQKVSAGIAAGLQQLQQRLQEMSSSSGSEDRRRLLGDFEERQAQFMATATAQLAEIQSREASFRTSADELLAQLSRQAEQSMAALRSQVEELVARHESDLNSRLSVRQEEIVRKFDNESEKLLALQAAADRALQAIDEHQQAAAKNETAIARAAEAALEKIDSRHAAAQSAIDKAAAESLQKLAAGAEAGQQELDKRLQQQAWDYEAQAEAAAGRLQERLAVALQKLETDIEQKQAALSANLTSDANKVAEALRSTLRGDSERLVADIAAERERQAGAFREQIEKELRQRDSEIQARQQAVAASMAALESQHQQVAGELSELQKTKSHIESLMAALPDTVRTQAEQHASEAWTRLRAQSEQHISETLQSETQRGAARLVEEITASARQLREEMAEHAQQTAAQLQARLAEVLSDRQQQVARETQATLQKTAGEIVSSEVERAQKEVREAAKLDREAALAALRADSSKVIVEHSAKLSSALERAEGLAEKMDAAHALADTKSQALQKQLDDAQRWLGEHTEEFQKTVHDAFLLAGGEIRGRVHAAVDSADEMIRQKSKDVMASVEAANAQHVQALAKQAEETQARLLAMQNSATDSAEAVLKSRLAETLELFREDAARLAESALARWQSAMDDTLRSIPDLLRSKMEPATPPSTKNASSGS